MIKANELRIGNWVRGKNKYKQTEELIQVESIHYKGINVFDDTEYGHPVIEADYSFDCLQPIPLTPELLERAGFEKETSEDIEERTIYSIQVANNTSLYFDPHKDWMRDDYEVEWYLSHEWNNNHFKNDFWKRPKYLHQLQNLYFTLTGEELNIDL
jgi:hypothetical protein